MLKSFPGKLQLKRLNPNASDKATTMMSTSKRGRGRERGSATGVAGGTHNRDKKKEEQQRRDVNDDNDSDQDDEMEMETKMETATLTKTANLVQQFHVSTATNAQQIQSDIDNAGKARIIKTIIATKNQRQSESKSSYPRHIFRVYIVVWGYSVPMLSKFAKHRGNIER